MTPVNAAMCYDCEDIVESKYRHDFRQCSCGRIFVDGGQDYQRIGAMPGDPKYYVFTSREEMEAAIRLKESKK